MALLAEHVSEAGKENMSTHRLSTIPKVLIDLPDTMSDDKQAAFVSAFEREAAQQCGRKPTVTCVGCKGQYDDNECKYPNTDKRTCFRPANM